MKMAEQFDFSRSKMSEILDALEFAGLLRRIYPYGPYLGDVVSRKSSKYLFATPAFRVLFYRLFSDVISDSMAQDKIAEDIVAMYFIKAFDRIGRGLLSYDGMAG